MHKVDVNSTLEYEISSPTTLLINVAAAMTDHQFVEKEELRVTPSLDATAITVGDLNNRCHRLQLQPGSITIEYEATVQLSPTVADTSDIQQTPQGILDADVLTYLYPSRYCESDRLSQIAFDQFGILNQDYARVNTICDWVAAYITYQAGTTDSRTTAVDVFVQRSGVCRDFAHLAITFCRSLGVPARYVSGYACQLTPPDFHGFFEAYLDGDWYLFDPTRLAPPAGLVRIGVGRDAADTAFATTWGQATLLSSEVHAVEQVANLDARSGAVGVSTA